MENLFFSLQKGNKFERQIDILKYLKQYPQTSIKEIAQHLEKSNATVTRDIQEISEELAWNDFHIKISENGLYSVHYPNHFPIDSLIAHLGKRTPVYQIIDSIFKEKKFSLLQALEKFSLSKTKYFDIIRHMRPVLEKYDLDIKGSPLCFIGNETDIRIFLFDFFQSFSDFSFIDEETSRLSEQLIQIAKNSSAESLNFCFHKLAFHLNIAKVRLRKKQFVYPNTELQEIAKKSKGFPEFRKEFLLFYQNNLSHLQLPEQEIVHGYFVVLSCVLYNNPKQLSIENLHLKFHRPEKEEVVLEIQSFLKKNIPEKYASRMLSFLVNLRLLSKVSPSFEISDIAVKSFVIHHHYDFWMLWYRALANVEEGSFLSFTHISDIAASLAVLHISIVSNQTAQANKLTVLFSFCGKNGFDDYLISHSTQYLTQSIQAIYQLESSLSTKKILELQPSLIVTNYDLNKDDTLTIPHIRLANIPTLADWSKMSSVINKLQETLFVL